MLFESFGFALISVLDGKVTHTKLMSLITSFSVRVNAFWVI